MKHYLTRGKAHFAASVLFAFSAGTSYADWHSTTQADRNQRIVNQAQHDLSLVGGACKVWIYDVVRVASNLANGTNGNGPNTVYLPPTRPYNGESSAGYDWYPDPNVYGERVYPSFMQPGTIVQMRIRQRSGGYIPHTAIVLSNSPSSGRMTFIESNYSGDYVVKTRSLSYVDFFASLETRDSYMVYTIR